MNITQISELIIHQNFEGMELFGFETRNKYSISDSQGNPWGHAAEQQKGIFGFLFRQVFGHWRSFQIHFFGPDRQPYMIAKHPFRFFFQRLEVIDPNDQFVGAIQQRFAIFRKRFDVQNSHGEVVLKMSSPFWRIWTFPIYKRDQEVARIEKKWAGLLTEMFTDKDRFLVSYSSSSLSENDRKVILAASIFIDLQYFEKKANDD